jgi:homogentisate 1,2-dioxygenase
LHLELEQHTDQTIAYRPPYYHRNGASELMGLIYGEYAGRSDEFQPGGISFECGFVPHGVAYEEVCLNLQNPHINIANKVLVQGSERRTTTRNAHL